ncbi:M20 family metallopeptidase [Brevundimonas terrae]|uniref:M20 family metallopeptidase n=1 Tax=Brevundimonas terrae TaxID=363631 RepID=A0ABP3HZ97_9CAUL|nr:amidohydrolase [Brevundimonas terrae]NIJ25483.1 hippurate hydrolase [Brevundimonas terrae]
MRHHQHRFAQRLLASCALIGLIGTAMPAMAADQALSEAVRADYQANLAGLFDDFHRHPELSGQETRTAARMAAELKALGYKVTEGVGGTGVVAVLENGPGTTVLIRADMDGLPIQERSGASNPSTHKQIDRDGVEQYVMHACGHDTHITALIGTARQMAARKANWSGTLVLIAQPAEERVEGARAMINDGLFTRFPKPEYAIGFHVASGLPAGTVWVPPAIAYSSADSVDIKVRGIGGHGASPQSTVDPVVISAQIISALQTLRSREVDPLQGAVVTVGSIHGGTKHNIVPEEVNLQLTVRSDSYEVRDTLLDGIDRIALNTARALNVPEDKLPVVVRSPTESTPPTINHTETATRMKAAIASQLGSERVVDISRQGMGAEDFAFYGAPEHGVKAVIFAVGGLPEDLKDTPPPHHSPLFRIDPEPSIIAGVEATVAAAEDLFSTGH